MREPLAVVGEIQGQVLVLLSSGEKVLAVPGMPINLHDIIITHNDSKVILNLPNGNIVSIYDGETIKIDEDTLALLESENDDVNEESLSASKSQNEEFLETEDLDKIVENEEPAMGLESNYISFGELEESGYDEFNVISEDAVENETETQLRYQSDNEAISNSSTYAYIYESNNTTDNQTNNTTEENQDVIIEDEDEAVVQIANLPSQAPAQLPEINNGNAGQGGGGNSGSPGQGGGGRSGRKDTESLDTTTSQTSTEDTSYVPTDF